MPQFVAAPAGRTFRYRRISTELEIEMTRVRRNDCCNHGGGMCHGGRGFTLIELMVVVVIVGVLSAIAVYMFSKQTRQAKATEVSAVFAEMRVRQEQRLLEQGSYICLSTTAPNCDDTAMFPDNTIDRTPDTLTPANLAHAQWGNPAPAPPPGPGLNMDLDKNALLCRYAIVAGPANDVSNIVDAGNAAVRFGFTQAAINAIGPQDSWYYLIATCDLDDNPGNPASTGDQNDSWYFARWDKDNIVVVNKGR